ncbi:hypothetical protein QW180_15090 [Vibrio sinaloensis]|nr:hypothetical protein [Vibrio sinaloensis]
MVKKVLVVCMGNICRSPTGEAILRAKAKQRDIALTVDSAGTIGYHQGNPPDSRSRAAGEKKGDIHLKVFALAKLSLPIFDEFDLIFSGR